MHCSMLALLLAAGLYGQTPPLRSIPQPDQPPVGAPPDVNQAGQPELPALPNLRLFQAEQPKPPSTRWKLLPFGKLFPFGRRPVTANPPLRLLPSGNGGRPPLVRPLVQPLVRPQPMPNIGSRPCAIPLTNALKPAEPSLNMPLVPVPNSGFPMREVRVPKPSCDDVQPNSAVRRK